jgi:hypothetical protein
MMPSTLFCRKPLFKAAVVVKAAAADLLASFLYRTYVLVLNLAARDGAKLMPLRNGTE